MLSLHFWLQLARPRSHSLCDSKRFAESKADGAQQGATRGMPSYVVGKIFFALGIPLDIPDKSVAVSFYFEANYALPFELNSSYFYEGTYYAKRSLSRQLVYKVITSKIDSFGYPGLDCLLRTICEAGKYSLNENGVLGDILRIIFTPSMSMNEDLPDEIIEAENEQHCNQRYERCPVNLLDLASY
ncbi:hypothetical protein ALC53_01979 [Atta colombica]|uniref:Uncharacterized protein n=1 Tax=Atta colombica TaxID=520822 RepID=A0A195BRK3_9HYME|nr:hypothetical protein ALC53_01979 [Atta colombica]